MASTQTASKTAPAKPAAAAKPQPTACRCGCGEATVRATAMYRMGHDARHASLLVKAHMAGEITAAKAIGTAGKTSEKLARKVERGIEVAKERATKQAAAAKARETAKAEREKARATKAAATKAPASSK